jgi:hypothetical protein
MRFEDTDDVRVLFAELHNHLADVDGRLQRLAEAASEEGHLEIEAGVIPVRDEVAAGQITRSKLEALIFDGRRI